MAPKRDAEAPKPELDDYLVFFEAEPRILDPKNGWGYGTEFKLARGSDRITAMVAPNDGEFTFQWLRDGQVQANLRLQGVIDWIIEAKDGAERLVLEFHQPGIESFILQLKPHVSLRWETTWA